MMQCRLLTRALIFLDFLETCYKLLLGKGCGRFHSSFDFLFAHRER